MEIETKAIKVPKQKISYKVEIFGEDKQIDGEAYASILFREIYKDEIFARRGIARVQSEFALGMELRLSIKVGRDPWTILESFELNKI